MVLAYFFHVVYLCDICVEIAKTFHSIDILFVIRVAYFKASPLSLVPLVICVMSLMCFVTAPVWYPKIWAKFSLFALHCIYLTKLLKLNKATPGKF